MAPPVPSANDAFHSAQDIRDYAAWLDARMSDDDAVIQAATGLATAPLSALSGTQLVFALFNSGAPVPARALEPQWIVFRQQWAEDYDRLRNGQPMVHAPIWASIATAGVADSIAALLTLGSFASGSDPWSQLKGYHHALQEWGPRWGAIAVSLPELPDVPDGNKKGGPSGTTLAIFTGAVALLGAYAGYELAPTTQKPIGALAGAAIGGGVTFFALR